jgi:hypothetical protein
LDKSPFPRGAASLHLPTPARLEQNLSITSSYSRVQLLAGMSDPYQPFSYPGSPPLYYTWDSGPGADPSTSGLPWPSQQIEYLQASNLNAESLATTDEVYLQPDPLDVPVEFTRQASGLSIMEPDSVLRESGRTYHKDGKYLLPNDGVSCLLLLVNVPNRSSYREGGARPARLPARRVQETPGRQAIAGPGSAGAGARTRHCHRDGYMGHRVR